MPSPRQKVEAEAPVPLFKFVTGRLPETSLARLTSAVPTLPAVAFKKPESAAIERFDVKRLVEEAVVAKKEVEVAFVVVERRRFGRSVSVPSVVVALMRASARASVKY